MVRGTTIDPRLQELMRQLEPASSVNGSLARLLAKELERELAIYEQQDAHWRIQYQMPFEQFARSRRMQRPSSATEQDYFDWELATSRIRELRTELARVKPLLAA
jgi:hypothetical protein